MKVELIDTFGDDDMVCDVARVSFDKLASNYTRKQNDGLIRHLAREGHWSPFSHPKVQLRFTAPIAIARQLFKHMIGGERAEGEITDWNEVSRRYVDDQPKVDLPSNWRMRPEKSIKQGSGSHFPSGLNAVICREAEEYTSAGVELYDGMISSRVAPEQARFILPQGTETSWIWTGSLAFWARVVAQRIDSHAQREVQVVAELIHNRIIESAMFDTSFPELLKWEGYRMRMADIVKNTKTLVEWLDTQPLDIPEVKELKRLLDI